MRRSRRLPAAGEVTRRKVSGLYNTDDPFYQTAPTEATRALWAMTVRVEPHGEPAFEADIEAWLWESERPSMEWLIAVLYDPSDHGKVVFDHSAEARKAANQATFEMRERWMQEQAANPLDRLTELMALRDRGVLTGPEYEAQKRKLLGQ
ncbi:SHOCT domain-containing protein [Mycobacterium sp.]|uniref:SHOCT domain-containing protein n=1 Tax=Mycobacterium sp. TaxID=1785 RepID=UPI002B7FBF93|nr:SHOCT domain-containing protein [Mycobacterium sp.]HTQ17433.1 SHOCT domain-containing protein [Mycobacterium sp.]